jgi:hypothetical protein
LSPSWGNAGSAMKGEDGIASGRLC